MHGDLEPGGQDGPTESCAAVPEEAYLRCVCGGNRNIRGCLQVRAESTHLAAGLEDPGWAPGGRMGHIGGC